MDLNQISSNIIKAAINIHSELGPGLLESVYQSCLVVELKQMGMNVEQLDKEKYSQRSLRTRA